jgi:hypothetical protein
MTGMKGWQIATQHSGSAGTFDRDPVFIPELVLETCDGLNQDEVKPLLDTVWNAAGSPCSPNYDAQGLGIPGLWLVRSIALRQVAARSYSRGPGPARVPGPGRARYGKRGTIVSPSMTNSRDLIKAAQVAADLGCLIPGFDGAFLSQDSKDALWHKFYTEVLMMAKTA